jgi:hypothetical protein
VFFNHLDGEGRLLLADLVVHATTPFAEIARSSERIVFVDRGEFVEGRIVEDKERGWHPARVSGRSPRADARRRLGELGVTPTLSNLYQTSPAPLMP